MPEPQTVSIDLSLHPKQELAYLSEATEILYGGSAGGGKSHLMRVAAIAWCMGICGLQVYLFRRVRDDLIKNHVEGPKGFRALLGPWVQKKWVTIVEDEIRFDTTQSKIYLCHAKDAKDVFKYQGSEIHVLMIDELTHWTETMYRFLRHRVRMVGVELPPVLKKRFPRILCGANPGNVGHLWCKKFFIDSAPPFQIHRTSEQEGAMLRQFLPARLEDNPSMAKDDPSYESRLTGLGSPQLVRAMRWGDWSVLEGQFFPEFNPDFHVITPFEIPESWMRFHVIDWGTADPCAMIWCAVVGDAYETSDGRLLPRGAIIQYREIYLSEDHNNVGLNNTAEEVAEMIVKAERYEPKGEDGRPRIAYRERDTELAAGNPSVAERMAKEPFNLFFRMAKNTRRGKQSQPAGWDFVRQRLKTGTIFFFSSCIDTIRCLPALVHDPDRPGDCIDEGVESHLPDCVRYGTMSRPWVASSNMPTPKYDTEASRTNTVIIRPPPEGWLYDLEHENPPHRTAPSLKLGGKRIQ